MAAASIKIIAMGAFVAHYASSRADTSHALLAVAISLILYGAIAPPSTISSPPPIVRLASILTSLFLLINAVQDDHLPIHLRAILAASAIALGVNLISRRPTKK